MAGEKQDYLEGGSIHPWINKAMRV